MTSYGNADYSSARTSGPTVGSGKASAHLGTDGARDANPACGAATDRSPGDGHAVQWAGQGHAVADDRRQHPAQGALAKRADGQGAGARRGCDWPGSIPGR